MQSEDIQRDHPCTHLDRRSDLRHKAQNSQDCRSTPDRRAAARVAKGPPGTGCAPCRTARTAKTPVAALTHSVMRTQCPRRSVKGLQPPASAAQPEGRPESRHTPGRRGPIAIRGTRSPVGAGRHGKKIQSAHQNSPHAARPFPAITDPIADGMIQRGGRRKAVCALRASSDKGTESPRRNDTGVSAENAVPTAGWWQAPDHRERGPTAPGNIESGGNSGPRPKPGLVGGHQIGSERLPGRVIHVSRLRPERKT